MKSPKTKLATLDEGNDLIPTRRSLLSRLKNCEDQESWKVFFDTYWKLIFRCGLRAGLTREEAEDVVQETVVSVMKSMPSFEYDPALGSFKGWLLQLTGWRIRDQFGKRQKRIAPERAEGDTGTGTGLLEGIPDPAWQTFERFWEQEWETNVQEAALARIRNKVAARHYRIFDLHVLQGWPVSKVASALRTNIGQVYLVKHRLTHLFKKEIAHLRTKPI